MPSDSYRESKLQKLMEDPEYASMYLEYSLCEAMEDGFIGGFLVGLEDVVEAANRRQCEASKEDVLRQKLHNKLTTLENPTLESIISTLEEVGLTREMKPTRAQVTS
ncbi:MAG: transcriptional regulator [Cyanobacteria bacterium J06634_6]